MLLITVQYELQRFEVFERRSPRLLLEVWTSICFLSFVNSSPTRLFPDVLKMYFQSLTFVTGISLALLSEVQAIPSDYITTITPLSTSVIIDEPPTSTPPNLSTWIPPTSLSNLSTWAPPNATIQNTTSLESLPLSTILSLPTSTSALLNTTSSYLYPNATVTQPVYNTSSTISDAFNTSTPTPIYTNATATQSWFTYTQNTTRPGGPTPAPVKLSPALPPSLDPNDPAILQPNSSVSLYFQAPPRSNSSGNSLPLPGISLNQSNNSQKSPWHQSTSPK